MDIDLGPVIAGIFIIFIVIPSVLGLLLGAILGYRFLRKRKINKHKKIILVSLCSLALAVAFPVIFVNLERLYDGYEHNRVGSKLVQFEKELAEKYSIEDVSVSNGSYQLTITVPYEGNYWLTIDTYQEKSCRQIYSPFIAANTKLLKLNSGQNTISGLLNDPKYNAADFCTRLYSRYGSTIPDTVTVATLNPAKPLDFVVKVESDNTWDKLLNEKRNIVVTNRDSVIKDGSVIMYSPRLSISGQCPIYNHINYSTCFPEDNLKIN